MRLSWLSRVTVGALVLLVSALIFATHYRWILTHFSSDGYLEDSGWLAYLFGAADPLLRNPSGVNGLSFYAHHLSPHIWLFGAPLAKVFGLTGFEIFAWHQGAFFGLFFMSCCLIAARAGLSRRDQLIAAASAALIGALSNALFQAAGYPHYEIAMIALTSLAIGAWLAGYGRLFVLCLIWLPLVREDGGFYVAVACLACVAVERDRQPHPHSHTRRLIVLALAGVGVSAASFLIKAWFFPGFDAFAHNFSGHRWNHVTVPFLVERAAAMLHNLNIVPVLVGCAVLSAFDVQYATGLLLLSPLYLLHVLAIRPEHGHFTLYFALPWLLPPVIWLAVFMRRAGTSQAAFPEAAFLLAAALALSAPIHAAAGARGNSWYVATWAFARPVANIKDMQNYLRWVRKEAPAIAEGLGADQRGQCMSQGIAALIPNEIRPGEVLTPDADLRACQIVLLLRGEMYYARFSERAEAAGLTPAGGRRNVEMWLLTGRR
jgi:hypothetical protein